jgi:hypothetical protein
LVDASLAEPAASFGSNSFGSVGPVAPASNPTPVVPRVHPESENPVRAVHCVPSEGSDGTRTRTGA